MRTKILATVAGVCLLAGISPATATPQAKWLANHHFSSSTDGWTAEGTEGSIQRYTGPAGEAPRLRVTSTSDTSPFLARSPQVPPGVERFVWHFAMRSAGATAIAMGARGDGDQTVFNVTVSAGSINVGPISHQRFGAAGTSWHRLDVIRNGPNYDVILDGEETITVAPTNAVPIDTFVVAPRNTSIYIDNLTFWGAGSRLETAFFAAAPAFTHVVEGVGGEVSLVPNDSYLDKGVAYVWGSANPMSRAFIEWRIDDIGPKWQTNLGFRNVNSVFVPDHMAVLAGLGDDGLTRWAITVAPGTSPATVGSLVLCLVDDRGLVEELMQVEQDTFEFHDLSVVADATASTLQIRMSSSALISLTSIDLSTTTRLAVGDVFLGPGTYVATGLTVLGTTGYGEMIFDDIETSAL
ncbi:MAG TPA: hypothetical protein VNA87_06795 [Actinomycetota bacterium]|nr:hypothetical protein [Actinomycetota bacterium]